MVNAEFLHDRLPRSKLDIHDAGYFTWEDTADQYQPGRGADRKMDRGDRKNLTTIYITHGHGDHFFGLNLIISASLRPGPSPRQPCSPKPRTS